MESANSSSRQKAPCILAKKIMKNTLSNDEIINRMKEITGQENDNQLAKYLGVERQQIRQFKNGERIGIIQLIITDLLCKLDAKDQ
jgi:hypothetical protein